MKDMGMEKIIFNKDHVLTMPDNYEEFISPEIY